MVADQYAEVFDSVGAGLADTLTADIWERLAPVAEEHPVLEGRGGLFADIPELPNMWFAPEKQPTFLVFGFELARGVLRDAEAFSSAGNAAFDLLFGTAIVSTDGAQHERYRTAAMPAFKRSTLQRWMAERIGPTVSAAVDALAGRERVDLVRDYAFPVPFRSTARVIGLQESAQFEVTRLVNLVLNVAANPPAGIVASRRLRDFMADVVRDRQASPGDDMTSALIASGVDGQTLGFEEIVSFLRLLGPAAMDTTYRSMSNLLFALLHNGDQLQSVRANPDLIPHAIEEALRWETVGPFMQRTSVTDTDIGGVFVPAGSLVSVCAGIANRDPSRWDDPHRFDIFRPQKGHLTFGGGVHTCLGLHIAREIIRESVRQLLDRFPRIELDRVTPPPAVTGLMLRSPASLPVVLG